MLGARPQKNLACGVRAVGVLTLFVVLWGGSGSGVSDSTAVRGVGGGWMGLARRGGAERTLGGGGGGEQQAWLSVLSLGF